jgi:hypothetical protein
MNDDQIATCVAFIAAVCFAIIGVHLIRTDSFVVGVVFSGVSAICAVLTYRGILWWKNDD